MVYNYMEHINTIIFKDDKCFPADSFSHQLFKKVYFTAISWEINSFQPIYYYILSTAKGLRNDKGEGGGGAKGGGG